MAKTKIEWVGHVWNPLAGCTVLTPGCKRCYAMKLAARLARMGTPLYAGLTKETKGGAVWTGEMRRASNDVLLAPLKRKKPTTYFVNSMSDLFHENVPDEWIDDIFAVMALTPHHTYQILTKRAARMHAYMTERWQPSKAQTLDFGGAKIDMPAETVGEDRRDQVLGAIDGIFDVEPELKARFVNTDDDSLWTEDGNAKCIRFAWPLQNVCLGVSTERQPEADERIPLLLKTPATVRFISAEPLLSPIDLTRISFGEGDDRHKRDALSGQARLYSEGVDGHPDFTVLTKLEKPMTRLDWVIVGGESGNGYRDMPHEWAQSLIDQCVGADVPVFLKQMAGKKPIPPGMAIRQFPRSAA